MIQCIPKLMKDYLYTAHDQFIKTKPGHLHLSLLPEVDTDEFITDLVPARTDNCRKGTQSDTYMYYVHTCKLANIYRASHFQTPPFKEGKVLVYIE